MMEDKDQKEWPEISHLAVNTSAFEQQGTLFKHKIKAVFVDGSNADIGFVAQHLHRKPVVYDYFVKFPDVGLTFSEEDTTEKPAEMLMQIIESYKWFKTKGPAVDKITITAHTLLDELATKLEGDIDETEQFVTFSMDEFEMFLETLNTQRLYTKIIKE